MNTTPDETKLARWLEDELEGDELAAIEAWIAGHPEHLAERERVRKWRAMISAAVPAAEEPPYPDFFNSRVARAIRESTPQPAVASRTWAGWRKFLMPAAACAGMTLAFWLGTKTHGGPVEVDVTGAPKAIPVEPLVYTPEKGVEAECFSSSKASATVIVLNGVDAIPDETDFSDSTSMRGMREINQTVSIQMDNLEGAIR